MPIDLSNLSNLTTIPAIKYTPKFFDKNLTGSGNTTGVLKNSANPINNRITTGEAEVANELFNYIRPFKYTRTKVNDSHNTEIDHFYTIDPYYNEQNLSIWDLSHDHFGKFAKLTDNCYVRLLPYRLRLRTVNIVGAKHPVRTILPAYTLQFVNGKLTSPKFYLFDQTSRSSYIYDLNTYYLDQWDHVFQQANSYVNLHILDVQNAMTLLKPAITNSLGKSAYTAFTSYIKSFNLYDSLCQMSKAYQEHIVDIIKMADIAQNYQYIFDQNKIIRQDSQSQAISKILDIITGLRLPLDQYQDIYQYLAQVYKNDSDTLNDLIDSNLNLKFNNLLNQLNNVKDQLAVNPKAQVKIDPELSSEQKRATTAHGPLSLVEAGAGTGKSSVILNRIKYLIDCGVEARDILVLSFTNAAADHIKHLYPGIKSTTIASLVNNIYMNNYPNQAIVSSTTFYNTLCIAYNDSQSNFMKKFIAASYNLTRHPREDDINYLDEGYKEMANLTKKKPNLVKNICKTLGQTTLDLQIIMAYTELEKITIPDSNSAKFVLVDEVQDNSIFDFMFLLKYVLVKRANFFIVGDASQTLYAFRNANPRAMNVLEASSVFDNYKLQINFRSRQEILTYANVLLSQMQSNIFAKIQLKANNLRQPTKKDFENNVNIVFRQASYQKRSHSQAINQVLLADSQVKNYVEKCLKRGEKVAFLAYTHRDLAAIAKSVGFVLNNKGADISSRHTEDMSLFSGFWANVSNSRLANLARSTPNDILDHVKHMLTDSDLDDKYRAALDYKLAQWDKFVTQNSVVLTDYLNQAKNGKITTRKYISTIMHLMLNYEIKINRIKQQTAKNYNKADKKLNIINQNQILFSTIHSAKGLEFDNAVVFIPETRNMTEEYKRLYYVALTRAKNSEQIILISSRNIDHSPLMTNYKIARKEFD